MTAILLAAGVGKRMGADAVPKCLLRVAGKSVLAHTLDALRAAGVRDVVLVVGYRRQEVEAEARAHAGAVHLTFIGNPRFREGAILSLWSAALLLDRPVIVMDADVFCPPAFLERLVHSPHENCLLADPSSPDTGEEQLLLGRDGRVLHIAKKPSPELRASMEAYGESVGFLKLSREAARELAGLLERRVNAGEVLIEHEQVYPELFARFPVGFENVAGIPWTEIDTPGDLERAGTIAGAWTDARFINRRISHKFLPKVLELPVTPNQWTGIGLLLGLAGAELIGTGRYLHGLLGAALFQLFYITDNWDGEVARAKGLSSKWGGWFDVIVDGIVQVSLVLNLSDGIADAGGPGWARGFGWFSALGIGLDFAVTYWAKARGFGPGIVGDPMRAPKGSAGSWFDRVVRPNLTHENFSLLVIAAMLLSARLPFLLMMGIGAHVFWVRYLLRNGEKLYSLDQARR